MLWQLTAREIRYMAVNVLNAVLMQLHPAHNIHRTIPERGLEHSGGPWLQRRCRMSPNKSCANRTEYILFHPTSRLLVKEALRMANLPTVSVPTG